MDIKYTFTDLCVDSDESTKKSKQVSAFFEYGYVGDEFIAMHILKAPI